MRKSMDSAGKLVYANKVVMEQLLPTKKVTKSHKNRYPTYVECI